MQLSLNDGTREGTGGPLGLRVLW